MSLIDCPACGKQVSKIAPACPHCGHPIAPSPAVATQKIVVEQPKSGDWVGGCLLSLFLLCVGGILLCQTNFGKELVNQGQQLVEQGLQITDSQRIVGTWKKQDSSFTATFYSDGTLSVDGPFGPRKGKYSLLPNRRMKTTIEGFLWGENEGTERYSFSGDELVLTPDAGAGISVRLRKVN